MSRLKILLAEDDRGLGMIVKAFLDAQGYPTTLCSNGEEAWNSLRDVQYDLCITDVMMPVMDGFTLLKQIKAVQPMMPVIVLTAKKEQDDILEGFSLGADDYITKPFSMDELLARIKVWERWLTYSPADTPACEFRMGGFTFNVPHLTLTDANADHLGGGEPHQRPLDGRLHHQTPQVFQGRPRRRHCECPWRGIQAGGEVRP